MKQLTPEEEFLLRFRKGLKFTSQTFAAKAEVYEVIKESNIVKVILTQSDDLASVVTWNYDETIKNFKGGIYKENDQKEVNIHVW